MIHATLKNILQLRTNSFFRQLLVSLLIIFLPCLSSAQYPFDNPVIYNTLNGLPSNRIMAVAEGADGFAWVGTDNGLCRLDGTLVQTFNYVEGDTNSLNNAFIMHLLADEKSGMIWVATLSGISLFDPQKNIFKNYKHDPNNPNSVPDSRANRILKDKSGQIWIGFKDGGILRYRPESDDFERFLHKDDSLHDNPPAFTISVVDIREDLNNDSLFWLGTQQGIVRFNKITGGHKQFVYGANEPLLPAAPNNTRCIFNHTNGKIYYGTWWAGVYFFDIPTKTFSKLNACYENGSEFFPRDVIISFYPKSKHEFWINSTTGLQLYDTRTGCITQSFKNDEEQAFSVDHIDSRGRLWSGSRSNGFRIFNKLFQQSKHIYYEEIVDEKRPTYTRKILEDTIRKKLYVMSGMSRGMYILDQKNGQWELIPPPPNYNLDRMNGFRSTDMTWMEDGALLIPEFENIYWYKPGFKTLQRYPVQPPEGTTREMRKVIKDHEGKYWISAITNLLRLDVENQTIESFHEQLKELSAKTLGGDYLAEDTNGNIWFRELNGLLIFDRKKEQLIYHPHDGVHSRRNMGPIYSDDKGRIWFATGQELLGFSLADSIDTGVLKFFGKKDGLAGTVYAVIPHRDKLLLSLSNGLQEFDPATMQFGTFYDHRIGIGNGANEHEILSDGTLAHGTQRALKLYNPDSLKINEELPQPYVSSFSVFDKSWTLKSSPSQPDTVWLSYKQNFFSFEFSAIAFNMAEDIKFQYKLEGIDENWKDGTKRKFAAYTNVPGGDYRFLVRAINNEGNASEEPSVTYLHISTVWWKASWFWAFAFLLFVGIAYLVYKWRIAQVRKEERLKAEYERKLTNVEMSALRAQMNPHFIFNSLNSIEYYIITNEQEKAVDYLSRFSRLIRLILQNSKSTIVPLKDDLEALKLYIEIESMRFDNKFDYEVKMEKGLDPEVLEIPPMLMQPFVENSIWHGLMQKKDGKGKIDLSLRRSNGNLVCLIEDNGIGREAAQLIRSKSASKRKSYGMKITSDRLAMLNKLAGADASINIFDLKNNDGSAAGTRVELVIPL